MPVDTLRPNPNQPRTQFDPGGLEELAQSIREHGILQPLSVRRREEGWELVSGERRLRAARLAGLWEVPCIAVDVDDRASSLLALVENIQRRDLDYLEEAQALDKLIRTYHLSQEEAARRVGRSQSAVANKLRLLRLSPQVQDLLRRYGLTERHARALLRLEGDAAQRAALEHIASAGLTVAQTEQYIERLLTVQPKKRKPTYLIKDVRLFLNSLSRGLSVMQGAGIDAQCAREETDETILLTIRIPKTPAGAGRGAGKG
ncbi:ParB/RepB/Spo0J family partition protein [uncultured Intestinimonas sp.]|uniref:ParB/RepB/Spo0J family partition protein n=1 Tax=uncultured Intestinimonas sp. TaxID=1689265 RepID=UPI0025FBFA8C|nr:ParB/RepB/Spo0J family partition protein [uncultured Intestinimonas sp.]